MRATSEDQTMIVEIGSKIYDREYKQVQQHFTRTMDQSVFCSYLLEMNAKNEYFESGHADVPGSSVESWQPQ